MFDVTNYINKVRPPGSFRDWQTETQTKLALNSNPHERSPNQWPCRTLNKWIFTTWTNTDGTSGILRSSISYTWATANVRQQDIFIKGNPGNAQWKHMAIVSTRHKFGLRYIQGMSLTRFFWAPCSWFTPRFYWNQHTEMCLETAEETHKLGARSFT